MRQVCADRQHPINKPWEETRGLITCRGDNQAQPQDSRHSMAGYTFKDDTSGGGEGWWWLRHQPGHNRGQGFSGCQEGGPSPGRGPRAAQGCRAPLDCLEGARVAKEGGRSRTQVWRPRQSGESGTAKGRRGASPRHQEDARQALKVPAPASSSKMGKADSKEQATQNPGSIRSLQ